MKPGFTPTDSIAACSSASQKEHFPTFFTVRLPGLVGPGLRKNVLFDFLNDNNLHAIDSRGIFQFYPMVNLWYDIKTALGADMDLVQPRGRADQRGRCRTRMLWPQLRAGAAEGAGNL